MSRAEAASTRYPGWMHSTSTSRLHAPLCELVHLDTRRYEIGTRYRELMICHLGCRSMVNNVHSVHSRGVLRRGGPRGVGSARSYAVSLPCNSPRRHVRKQLPRIFTKLAPRTLCNTNGHRVASRFCLLYASSLVRWKFPSKPPRIIGDACKPRLFRHLAYGLHVISYSSRTTAG